MVPKTVVTYFGAISLFESMEAHIAASIAAEACEFKALHGRSVKNISLEVNFEQFSTEILEKYRKGELDILDHPVLHIFVTECDMEIYKATTKDEIHVWLKQLQSFDVTEWMILVVETIDVKKTKNLLPRTTVLDKVRLDFAANNGDRCITVLNPKKFEQKSTESFRCLIQRFKHLIFTSYNKNLIKYQDLIRVHRERRNRKGWSFIDYFSVQESYAFLLEKLQLPSEALVQYDELDALFSQYIVNSVMETHSWLNVFKKPLNRFNGIALCASGVGTSIRDKLLDGSITFLEFRNYVFERQCILLQLCHRWEEMCTRLITFLFSTLKECQTIHIDSPDGSLQCWEFICAMEVLKVCDDTMKVSQVQLFQHCAPLWNLAKDKLYEIGKLCGLLPGSVPTSQQLHIAVQLSTGIESIASVDAIAMTQAQLPLAGKTKIQTATEQLKVAISSNIAFQKLYLELCELAISTYKHVSYFRSARLVGLDLGRFYCALNESTKAVIFLTDLLYELKSEGWIGIASQVLLELATCYRKMNDISLYGKICATISCCLDLENLVRNFYFDEYLKNMKIMEKQNPLETENDSQTTVLEDHFKIVDIFLLNERIIQDDEILILLRINSYFPREILANEIKMFYQHTSATDKQQTDAKKTQKVSYNSRLPMSLHVDYKQDRKISSSSVTCSVKPKHMRRPSNLRQKYETAKITYENFILAETQTITPGQNELELKTKAKNLGNWEFKQLSIKIKKLEFLTRSLEELRCKSFLITAEPAKVILNFKKLIVGFEQEISMIISVGSFDFQPKSKLLLKCSKGLKIRKFDDQETFSDDELLEKFQNELTVSLENFQPFERREIPLEILTDLPGRNVEKHIEHKIVMICPWVKNETTVDVGFSPSILSSCRLHTCGTQKFLQVYLKGLNGELEFTNSRLTCDMEGVRLIGMNPTSPEKTILRKGQNSSFLWELQVEPLKPDHIIKVSYSANYRKLNSKFPLRTYLCAFDVMDYQTLFKIQAKIDPSELCRVGTVCNLDLKIIKLQETQFDELMYEVLADQNLWAIVGRTAGVVGMKNLTKQSITIEVLPLSVGFLPLPNIRLSKYITQNRNKSDVHSKLQPFPPGQIYNSTKSSQIHVLAAGQEEKE